MKSNRKARDSNRNHFKDHEQNGNQPPVILERRDRRQYSQPIKKTGFNNNGDSSSAADSPRQKPTINVLQANQQPPLSRQSLKKHQSQTKSNITSSLPSSTTTVSSQIPPSNTSSIKNKSSSPVVPFYRRNEHFNNESVLKVLADYPGHFVVGVIGQQGVGKSTILSHFTPDPIHAFASQPNDLFLAHGHKTNGIDMYVCPERMILLDTEPILSWSVFEKALRHYQLDSQPDTWLEMDSLYNLVFLLSICNVIVVVFNGTTVDMDIIHFLRRAEMLKFQIPDFPLIPPNHFGQTQPDVNYYPDIVFTCNKCQEDDFTWVKYKSVQTVLSKAFGESQLKTTGIGSLGNILPAYMNKDDNIKDMLNLYFLPYNQNINSSNNNVENDENKVESFYDIVSNLRNHVMSAPRKPGKKGQVSEKEWFKNTVKLYELVHKSEYISEYLKVVRKLRDG
ncbi:hypothetical protein BJ944DRAFT_207280 [Cunninghamella echinulata]|nr:hypothetical protein BJ944DRAFT_207280 [Cunninghamella echinulata]